MKITDRDLAIFGLVVATAALLYGYSASKQNKEILSHTKDIKKRLK